MKSLLNVAVALAASVCILFLASNAHAMDPQTVNIEIQGNQCPGFVTQNLDPNSTTDVQIGTDGQFNLPNFTTVDLSVEVFGATAVDGNPVFTDPHMVFFFDSSGVASLEVTTGSGPGNRVVVNCIVREVFQLVVVSGDNQTTEVNTAYAIPLTVRLVDPHNGNAPVPDVTLDFRAPRAPGFPSAVLSQASVVTDASGEASITATANGEAGNFNVSVNARGDRRSGDPATEAQFSLTSTAAPTTGPPANLVANSGAGQSAQINTAFANPLVARLRDPGGNPVPGATVNFAAPAAGGSATLSTTSAVTDANGEVSITATANGLEGAYDIVASSAGVSDATFNLNNVIRDRAAEIAQTRRVIRNFLVGRADRITSDDPDVINRLSDGGAGPVNGFSLSGHGVPDRYSASFSTSLSAMAYSLSGKGEPNTEAGEDLTAGFKTGTVASRSKGDMWVKGRLEHAQSQSRRADLGIVHAGADYRFSPDLIAGVMTSFDWADELDRAAGSSASGFGWLIGPYAAARLHEYLYFDGRVQAGGSSNKVSPFGTFRNKFSTGRWLVQGRLSGQFQMEDIVFKPLSPSSFSKKGSTPIRTVSATAFPARRSGWADSSSARR